MPKKDGFLNNLSQASSKNQAIKKKKEEIKLNEEEKMEKNELERKLHNSHKNVLRKLIAVWIF